MFHLRLHDHSVKNFLKTAAHQHKDPQVRLGFINDLQPDSDSAQETLSEMARDDQDIQVRIAAIAKIDELTTLRTLLDANGDHAQAIIDAAQNRLIEKLNKGEVSDIAARVLLSTHANRLAAPLAASGSVAEQRQMALDALEDEASLLAVVQQSRFHDTRLAAAMRLSQHDALRSALTAVRSKDKVVAKNLQQKLDAEAAAEAALIARRHAISTSLKSAQNLNEGVWTPQHGGRLQALKEKWATFEAQDTAEDQAAFEEAIAKADQRLLAYQAELARHSDNDQSTVKTVGERATTDDNTATQPDSPSTQSSVEPSVVPVQDSALEPILQELAPCDLEVLAQKLESLQTKVQADPAMTESENVSNVMAYAQSVAVLFDPPYELNKARPGALQQRIKRVAALLDVPALLPGIDLSQHTYVAELSSHHTQLNDRLGKAKQESADRIKATHRQFAALSGIIKEGKWGPANSMLRRLTKKLDAMEPAERSSLNDKLERAEKQLNEMADWQDFAARPKLVDLCEQMEALPAKELDPEGLAKQVRELQSAWKALGVSRASNELWARFKTAGDTAYEPCKAWFESKQVERQKKLDAKAALCEKLESEVSLLTGDPDWKSIVRLVNNAKRDWSRNRVPDRKPDKALEARFSAALNPFETALTEQYDANAAAKQELIGKVETLAQSEITQHSANQAKRLLSAWKLIGVMRRKEDQALWEVFNGHLGTIFKHQHKVAREKQRAELEHVFRAKEIIKKLRQLSRGDSLDEGEVQSLSSEFQALAEFPERDKKFLLKDFRQAVDACSRVQSNASRRRAQAERDEQQRLVQLCEQLEYDLENADSASGTLEDDILHAWDATEIRLPHELGVLLQNRRDAALAHRKNGTQPDFDENESLRRDLLIRMEVAAGVDTPNEDKARRMAYQLQHLQEGMTSSGIEDSQQVLAELEKQWISVGPVRSTVKDTLQSRFLKAYKR